jgi:hypothetical protein
MTVPADPVESSCIAPCALSFMTTLLPGVALVEIEPKECASPRKGLYFAAASVMKRASVTSGSWAAWALKASLAAREPIRFSA